MLSAKQKHNKVFFQVSSHRKRVRRDNIRGEVYPTQYFTEQMSCRVWASQRQASVTAQRNHSTLSEKSRILRNPLGI